MSRYRTKPHLVTAVQATSDTTVDGLYGPLLARPGEWIVKHDHGPVTVMTAEQFDAALEPVPSAADRGTPYVCWSESGPHANEVYTLRDGAYVALFPEQFIGNLRHRPATPEEVARGAWVDA
jgi:hypothetical protein